MWDTILWIAAVIIGIFGVLRLVQRDFVMGRSQSVDVTSGEGPRSRTP